MNELLIISFSELTRDPRVLRQIKLFADNGYCVTTMGHGARPSHADEHVELTASVKTTTQQRMLVAAELLSRPADKRYPLWPEVRSALPWLQRNRHRFDAVFVNDLMAVPLGLAAGRPLHADLHEYALGQSPALQWRIGVEPILRWAAPLLGRVDSTSTVAPGIAAQYLENYGISPFVVNNAPSTRHNYTPTKTATPIRLVHMGVANPVRSLEMPIMAAIEANKRHPNSVILDYYVVPGDAAYIERLRALSQTPGSGVTLQNPVEYDQMLPTLRNYDAAIAFFPPVTINLKHTLPNKFFEAVQARLGVITGPSPEMGPYIHEYGFGETTTDWTQEALNQTFTNLTPTKIDRWKEAAHKAAPKLGAEHQDQKWLEAIEKLTEPRGGKQ